jgi:hypothetical protein
MNYDLVNTIADQIVNAVERAGHPVTLVQIEQNVPGFAEPNPKAPAWDNVIGDDDGENLYWNGMTAEGCEALTQVMRQGRVALQFIHPVVYFIESRWPSDSNWVPIALAPRSMATLQGGAWRFAYPDDLVDRIMELAPTMGGGVEYRRLDRAS